MQIDVFIFLCLQIAIECGFPLFKHLHWEEDAVGPLCTLYLRACQLQSEWHLMAGSCTGSKEWVAAEWKMKNGLLCRSILVPMSTWACVLKLGHRDRSLTPALIQPAALQCKHRALLCGASLHIQYVKLLHNKAVATLAPSLILKAVRLMRSYDRRLWWWSFSCTILWAHLGI